MVTDNDRLRSLYETMARIRQFEKRTSDLYKKTEVPGFVHLSIGQEATAVGACAHLADTDYITSTHRGHGHCIAKGLDTYGMFAELMGKATGTNSGMGGSMHIANPDIGILGANGIVAAGLPIAVGAGTASVIRDDGRVVVSFFGDGAVAQGMFHESVNLAAVWGLPIVFFCENNHYSEFSAEADQHAAPLSERAAGYGIPHHAVDGNDVFAVAALMETVVAEVRAGGGPVIVEADTYRWHGHYEGDPERYRTQEELEEAQLRDPLLVARRQLAAAGVGEQELDDVDARIRGELEAEVERAREDPDVDPEAFLDLVYAPSPEIEEPASSDEDAPVFKVMHAVRAALEHEMTADESVYVAGVDVGEGGNVFGLFRGLIDDYPGRVRDTPISEAALLGSAVGAAMTGLKPVVELMYLDFVGVALDALLNQAAKLRFMTGGRAKMSLVVRTQYATGRSSGSQHSQSLEALLAHIPGLTVVMPSNPADAYGLLRASIQEPNPVIFIENRLQYGLKGPKPPEDHLVPLGKASVRRKGNDLTIVTYSKMVQKAETAADTLADEGIDAEVIDLRTVAPLDRRAILDSIEKTGRLVIAHEAAQDFGVGAEIAALAANEGFWHLKTPVARVASRATPVPYAPAAEANWLPTADDIADVARRIVRI